MIFSDILSFPRYIKFPEFEFPEILNIKFSDVHVARSAKVTLDAWTKENRRLAGAGLEEKLVRKLVADIEKVE